VENRLDAVVAAMTSAFDAVEFMHGEPMPNRFMLAPLTNQQSHADGTISEAERRFVTMRAFGGFGLTMTCASHVQAEGQGFPGQLGCWDDRHLDGLGGLAAEINATGSRSFLQLHHAGARSPAELIGTTPVGPCEDPETRALSTAEVSQVVADFVAAAVRADRAGFSGVELHGAHGYLICQFLSAETNRRTDAYGGSLENRARILFEIIDGIDSSCSDDLTVAVRLSPERFGIALAEAVEVFERLVACGRVDLIDMSLWDVRKPPEPAADIVSDQRGLIEIFASIPRGDVRLGVAGKIRTPADVSWVLDQGTYGVDIAVLGRAAILNHDFPQRCAIDPGFVPRPTPASEDDLRGEGLSDAFIGYMRNWRGFVAEPLST